MPPTNQRLVESKTQVWLAIIGAVGVLGAAYITNGRKGPIDPDPAPARISIHASDFRNSSGVAMAKGEMARYGKVLMNMGPPYVPRPNAAEFRFRANKAGTYRLSAKYASVDERPVTISLNGRRLITDGLGKTTNCMEETCQRWFPEGEVQLIAGLNVLRLERSNEFPLIHGFRLEAVQ